MSEDDAYRGNDDDRCLRRRHGPNDTKPSALEMRPTKAVLVVSSILGYPIPRILHLHLQIGAPWDPFE